MKITKLSLNKKPESVHFYLKIYIEEKESLPHPLLDGEWVKKSPLINSAYLIIEFGEDDIDRALEVVQKSGLKYLYHPDPFETWGHFELKKEFFPNGKEGLKMCVEKAERLGIKIGTHTLSNFINTSDPYVTPVPDKRLAIIGGSVVTGKIDEKQTEIEIKDPAFFDQEEKGHLQSLRINDEIIRYGSISKEEPWILKNCVRGAFGTKATSHNNGDEVSRLMDHGYKVFLTDMDLAEEIAENIADIFNYTGIRMLDFDGLEGNHSTGMGNYGEVLFAKAWYDRINDNIKDHFLLGASRPGHYFWHMYSRMNWGEPWYGGFRESQTGYRLKNQAYFKRNLMPGMLGWFLMTPTTSVEDIEWMLARSGGFNAGYAFVANYNALEANGKSEEILKLLGEWEKARTGGAFTKEQEMLMQDTDTEFHLEEINENSWKLTHMYSQKFTHAKKVRQPGEPLYSVFNFENPVKKQSMQFIISAKDGALSNISMEMNNHRKVMLNVTLTEGESIKYLGGNQVVIYSRNWKELRRINVDESVFLIESGNHSVTFDCDFNDSDEKPQAKIELRLEGESETISQNQ